MSENKNTPLDEMTNANRRPTISFDMTAGVPQNVPTNETENPVAEKKTVTEARVIQTGHVDMSNMQPIDIHSILPQREPEVDQVTANLYADLDAAIEREKQSIEERIDSIVEAQDREREEQFLKQEEVAQAKEDAFAVGYDDAGGVNASTGSTSGDNYYDDEDDDIPASNIRLLNNTPVQQPTPNFKFEDKSDTTVKAEQPAQQEEEKEEEVQIVSTIRNSDLFDDDEEEEDETPVATDDELGNKMLDALKAEVKQKITPIKKNIDLSKFTISKKATSAQKAMKLAVLSNQHVADWVMLAANRPISMSGLSGPEILKLNPQNTSRNRMNTFRDMYRVIYDHVCDANKPEFEAWLKQIKFIDMQHIYFALYAATFGGSNFISYTCPKCNKVFLKDFKLEDMVEYADEATREKVREILKMDTTSPSNDSYDVDLVQISDSYAFGLRAPSVWNVIIETASLSDKFLDKYADMIDVISYIDSIYYIDMERNELVPIDTKPDPNDQVKTSGRRIKTFYDIIRTLKSEEFYALRAKITEFDESDSKINYLIPAAVCPDCATEIPANKDVTPDNMLFTRHQLAAIGNL